MPSGNQISVSQTALLSGLDVDFALNAPTQQNQNSEYDIEIMTDCRVWGLVLHKCKVLFFLKQEKL